MPLVDYASSSDDDGSEDEEEPKEEPQVFKHEASPSTLPPNNQRSTASNKQLEDDVQSSAPLIEKLPDASLLLNSPATSFVSGDDHASRVAAAKAESASRKRDLNGLGSSLHRSKVPRGTLLHTKNVPDTVGNMLVPPQLTGRSNVVTEDIGKLFVRRQADPSTQ